MPACGINLASVIQGSAFWFEHYKKFFFKTKFAGSSCWIEGGALGKNFPLKLIGGIALF